MWSSCARLVTVCQRGSRRGYSTHSQPLRVLALLLLLADLCRALLYCIAKQACQFRFAEPACLFPKRSLQDYVATRWYRAPELLLGFTHYGKDPHRCIIGAFPSTFATSLHFPELSTVEGQLQVVLFTVVTAKLFPSLVLQVANLEGCRYLGRWLHHGRLAENPTASCWEGRGLMW